jgi:hypothetical protein
MEATTRIELVYTVLQTSKTVSHKPLILTRNLNKRVKGP